MIYERILTEVNNRIAAQLGTRIPELEDPLLTQLEERILFVVDARIASQVALLEARMATQLEEYIRERQENLMQGFSRAYELGIERSLWQSPSPDESALPLDESASESATPLDGLASGSAVESAMVENALALNALEDVAAPTTPDNKPAVEAAPAQGQNLEPLTSKKLGKRLDVDNATISRHKKPGNEHFREWSAALDPDGIAWEYREGDYHGSNFHPLI